jgi:uncharacterized protein
MSAALITLLKRMHASLVKICPEPLRPEGIHGAITAVALSPNPCTPNTWIPVLYNMKGDSPEFLDRNQAKEFLDTAILAYNSTVASLTGNEEYALTFSVGEKPDAAETAKLQAWCEGFIKGLRQTGVDPGSYDDDFISLMSPIAFCAKPDFFHGSEGAIEQDGQIHRIAKEIPANLIALRNYFYLTLQKKRMNTVTTQAGRNDPCPCGSGKKFKHCCGK